MIVRETNSPVARVREALRVFEYEVHASYRAHFPLKKRIPILGFDIVQGCQLRCVGCPNSTIKQKIHKISVADFRTCLGNVDAQRIGFLRLFNFGEALLHPDIPGILESIPGHSWRCECVEMSTNAQHHDFSMLAEAFKTGVLGRLVVSCDGDGTQESYEQLRPPAKWGRLIEFLTKAKELRDKHAPSVHLMTRTIAPSDDHRKRWSDILKPIGWEPEFRDWNIFPDALENRSNREAIPGRGVCGYVLAGKFYVKTDGTVVPCCAHPQAYRLGNLKMQTYSEIMNGELRRKFLHELRTARHKMPVCGKCVSGTGKC